MHWKELTSCLLNYNLGVFPIQHFNFFPAALRFFYDVRMNRNRHVQIWTKYSQAKQNWHLSSSKCQNCLTWDWNAFKNCEWDLIQKVNWMLNEIAKVNHHKVDAIKKGK